MVALLAAAVSVGACGGAPEESAFDAPFPEGRTRPADSPGPLASAVPFETCSFVTGGDDHLAECANVEVPLDWDAPADSKVTFFVKRLRGTAPGVHRQLWLLQGGPGGAGDGLEPVAAEISRADPSLDVYIPDHRGTGRSERLDCPNARGGLAFDYGTCLKEMKIRWGAKGLTTFSTTTAARDVGFVIERVRTPGQEVHIYGISYGTYWAQRYLQLFPEQPTAVALDGVCQAGLCSYLKMGYWFDRVGKKYMAECAADPVCGAKLGADPVAAVRSAIARAGAGTCAGLSKIDGPTLRKLYGMFIASFELRALVPATAYRILRCDADDVIALRRFESVLSGDLGTGFSGFDGIAGSKDLSSDILGMHIAFSELEENPPISRSDLAELLSDAVFTAYDPKLRDAYDMWPRYQPDALVGKYPTTRVPVLMMNGTLDPQTPLEFAEAIAPHYRFASQALVVLPRAAHGVIHQSPTTEGASEPSCGMMLWHQFIESPTGALDDACRANILPHDFAGSPALAQRFFGRPNLWGPAAAAAEPGAPTNAAPAAAEAALSAEMKRITLTTRPWQRPLGW
jgi:pimeloyl-ACP methyl ester carboxylesterase